MNRLPQAVFPSEEAVEEVEDAAELRMLRMEEDKGKVEAAVVALEGPHRQQAATLVRRQTEVNLIALSLFCHVTIVTKLLQEKAGRSVLHKAPSTVV